MTRMTTAIALLAHLISLTSGLKAVYRVGVLNNNGLPFYNTKYHEV